MTTAMAVDVGFFGGIFARQIVFADAGDVVPGHDHGFDHVTFVTQGRIRFQCDVTGVDREITAPAFVETPARARHTMTALVPESCAWCIFVVRDAPGAYA